MDKEYTFNGQRDGEKVVEIIPAHPYLLYTPGLKTILMLIAGIALILYLPKIYIVAIIIFLIAAVYFLREFYIYKETIFLITDQRLFSIEQQGFFKRKITEVDIEKVIDLSSETHGFAKMMLKYGDLIIRSAGAREGGDMILKNIPDPYYYQQKIAKLAKKIED